jgi:hypothetical protein
MHHEEVAHILRIEAVKNGTNLAKYLRSTIVGYVGQWAGMD